MGSRSKRKPRSALTSQSKYCECSFAARPSCQSALRVRPAHERSAMVGQRCGGLTPSPIPLPLPYPFPLSRVMHCKTVLAGCLVSLPPEAWMNRIASSMRLREPETELRRKTAAKLPVFEALNHWLAWLRYFGVSGPFCSLAGSNPLRDANRPNGTLSRVFFVVSGS
jgi:hypothetical protein